MGAGISDTRRSDAGGPTVASPPPDDRPVKPTNGAIEGKRERISASAQVRKDEQTLADTEHTLAETDQTRAEADQTSSDTDQTSADRDQFASDVAALLVASPNAGAIRTAFAQLKPDDTAADLIARADNERLEHPSPVDES